MARSFVYSITVDSGLVEHVALDALAADDLPRVGTAGGLVPAYLVVDQYGRVTGYTAAPPLGFTTAGKTVQLSDTKTLTTSDTELVLEETGDSLGTVRLRLQCRGGQAGPLFQGASLDVVDFGFQGATAAKKTLRYEGRGAGTALIGSGVEFQLGTADSPAFVSADGTEWTCGYDRTAAVIKSFRNNSTTSFRQPIADLINTWLDATHATRTGRLRIGTYYTSTFQEQVRMESGAATWTVYLANGTASFSSGGTASLAGGNFAVAADGTFVMAAGDFTVGVGGSVTLANGDSFFDAGGGWKPAALADASANADTVYFSTTASKLVYKDSGGTVHALY